MIDFDKSNSGILNIDEIIQRLLDRVGVLESRMARLEELINKPQPRLRIPRNYNDYIKVKELISRGSSINGAAKKLKLPYTTVHYYATANTETVERLKKITVMIDNDDFIGDKLEEDS
ncbi:MAG: hypothetical protein LBR53_02935 [Deltaproteobacteria bacterium]|jgi:hypothetical protein|nr:hypothetical protein [Deltaproteobacteria bacterium]